MALRLLFAWIIALFPAGALLAQQASPDAGQPVLRVQTDLVVVPFEVRRGARPVSECQDFRLSVRPSASTEALPICQRY
jgi:hypothetical protein